MMDTSTLKNTYSVPKQYSRGYGAPIPDVRGRGYFYGFGSLISGAGAMGSLIFLFALGGFNLIPAIMSIYLGILALKHAENPQRTDYSSKAKSYGTWGIILGSVSIVLTILLAIILAWAGISLSSI